jgi:hypothetical protein
LQLQGEKSKFQLQEPTEITATGAMEKKMHCGRPLSNLGRRPQSGGTFFN